MRVVAYLRVSTDQQVEHGQGLDVQRQAIRAWAKANAHTISSWAADEGASGSNGLDARVGLLDAFDSVRDHLARGIVVYRVDRLARDLVLQEQLLAEVWRMGGRVFSTSPSEDAYLDPEGAEGDPSRGLIRRILGAVSQYEREMIRLRLRAGKQRKAQDGGFLGGGAPLGFRVEDRGLVVDDDEQATVARIVELRSLGLSLPRICEQITVEGRRTKRGGSWHPQTVSLVLERAARGAS